MSLEPAQQSSDSPLRASKSLSTYPLQHLSYRLNRKMLDYMADAIVIARTLYDQEGKTVHTKQLRRIETIIGASMAGATCFQLIDQFRKKKKRDILWDNFADFKLPDGPIFRFVVTEATERLGFTGPHVQFISNRKGYKVRPPVLIIPTVVSIPYVQFLGWMTMEDMQTYSQGWAYIFTPMATKIKPLWTLENLEKSRVDGEYI